MSSGTQKREFVLLGLCASLFFFAYGAGLPVLPRFVLSLGGDGSDVGLVVGGLAVGALVVRPSLGRLGDRRGARRLLIGGSLLASAGFAATAFVHVIPLLVPLRAAIGAGQAAVMIGGTSLAIELVPEERRGEAAAFILVAFQLGVGSGPLLGELVLEHQGYGAVWLVCAAAALAAGVVATRLPARAGRGVSSSGKLLHPAGVKPGLVMMAAIFGHVAFAAFIPLLAVDAGVVRTGPLFVLMAATMVVSRVLGRHLPDRLGPVTGGAIACSLIATGLFGISQARQPAMLFAMTFVLGSGWALLFPCMVIPVVDGSATSGRSAALATFTMFLDIGSGLGGVVLGKVADATSYRHTFVTGGCAAVVAVLLVLFLVRPSLTRAIPKDSLMADNWPSERGRTCTTS
ncbi:MAG: hypothetical protein QOF60_3278 [Actinomycetota bacterium]|nr:hypothetical protein [Actinomycetota bacterium]